MSFDFSIVEPACAACGHIRRYDWDGCTWNLAPMWRATGYDLYDFNGKKASECAPILRKMIEAMRADPAKFKVLNPPNKWGSYDELMPCLERYLEAMEGLPNGIISVTS
jgi:hypothetical protein